MISNQPPKTRPVFTFDLVVVSEPIDLAALFRAWEDANAPIEAERLAQRHALHEAQIAFYRVWRRKNPRPAKWKPGLFAGPGR